MAESYQPPYRTWPQRLYAALASALASIRDQASFHVHVPVALLVTVCAVVFRVSRIEACLLVLCVFFVLAAEMLNTALERLAKAVDSQENEHLAVALNIGSGAVLTSACGAVIVGLVIFLFRLGVMLGWWTA